MVFTVATSSPMTGPERADAPLCLVLLEVRGGGV